MQTRHQPASEDQEQPMLQPTQPLEQVKEEPQSPSSSSLALRPKEKSAKNNHNTPSSSKNGMPSVKRSESPGVVVLAPGRYEAANEKLLSLQSPGPSRPHKARHSDRAPASQNKVLRSASFQNAKKLRSMSPASTRIALTEELLKRAYSQALSEDSPPKRNNTPQHNKQDKEENTSKPPSQTTTEENPSQEKTSLEQNLVAKEGEAETTSKPNVEKSSPSDASSSNKPSNEPVKPKVSSSSSNHQKPSATVSSTAASAAARPRPRRQRIYIRTASMPSLGVFGGMGDLSDNDEEDELLFTPTVAAAVSTIPSRTNTNAPRTLTTTTTRDTTTPLSSAVASVFSTPPRKVQRRRSGSYAEGLAGADNRRALAAAAAADFPRGIEAAFSGSSAGSSVISQLLQAASTLGNEHGPNNNRSNKEGDGNRDSSGDEGDAADVALLSSPPRIRPKKQKPSHFFLDDDSSLASFLSARRKHQGDGGDDDLSRGSSASSTASSRKIPSILQICTGFTTSMPSNKTSKNDTKNGETGKKKVANKKDSKKSRKSSSNSNESSDSTTKAAIAAAGNSSKRLNLKKSQSVPKLTGSSANSKTNAKPRRKGSEDSSSKTHKTESSEPGSPKRNLRKSLHGESEGESPTAIIINEASSRRMEQSKSEHATSHNDKKAQLKKSSSNHKLTNTTESSESTNKTSKRTRKRSVDNTRRIDILRQEAIDLKKAGPSSLNVNGGDSEDLNSQAASTNNSMEVNLKKSSSMHKLTTTSESSSNSKTKSAFRRGSEDSIGEKLQDATKSNQSRSVTTNDGVSPKRKDMKKTAASLQSGSASGRKDASSTEDSTSPASEEIALEEGHTSQHSQPKNSSSLPKFSGSAHATTNPTLSRRASDDSTGRGRKGPENSSHSVHTQRPLTGDSNKKDQEMKVSHSKPKDGVGKRKNSKPRTGLQKTERSSEDGETSDHPTNGEEKFVEEYDRKVDNLDETISSSKSKDALGKSNEMIGKKKNGKRSSSMHKVEKVTLVDQKHEPTSTNNRLSSQGHNKTMDDSTSSTASRGLFVEGGSKRRVMKKSTSHRRVGSSSEVRIDLKEGIGATSDAGSGDQNENSEHQQSPEKSKYVVLKRGSMEKSTSHRRVGSSGDPVDLISPEESKDVVLKRGSMEKSTSHRRVGSSGDPVDLIQPTIPNNNKTDDENIEQKDSPDKLKIGKAKRRSLEKASSLNHIGSSVHSMNAKMNGKTKRSEKEVSDLNTSHLQSHEPRDKRKDLRKSASMTKVAEDTKKKVVESIKQRGRERRGSGGVMRNGNTNTSVEKKEDIVPNAEPQRETVGNGKRTGTISGSEGLDNTLQPRHHAGLALDSTKKTEQLESRNDDSVIEKTTRDRVAQHTDARHDRRSFNTRERSTPEFSNEEAKENKPDIPDIERQTKREVVDELKRFAIEAKQSGRPLKKKKKKRQKAASLDHIELPRDEERSVVSLSENLLRRANEPKLGEEGALRSTNDTGLRKFMQKNNRPKSKSPKKMSSNASAPGSSRSRSRSRERQKRRDSPSTTEKGGATWVEFQILMEKLRLEQSIGRTDKSVASTEYRNKMKKRNSTGSLPSEKSNSKGSNHSPKKLMGTTGRNQRDGEGIRSEKDIPTSDTTSEVYQPGGASTEVKPRVPKKNERPESAPRSRSNAIQDSSPSKVRSTPKTTKREAKSSKKGGNKGPLEPASWPKPRRDKVAPKAMIPPEPPL